MIIFIPFIISSYPKWNADEKEVTAIIRRSETKDIDRLEKSFESVNLSYVDQVNKSIVQNKYKGRTFFLYIYKRNQDRKSILNDSEYRNFSTRTLTLEEIMNEAIVFYAFY